MCFRKRLRFLNSLAQISHASILILEDLFFFGTEAVFAAPTASSSILDLRKVIGKNSLSPPLRCHGRDYRRKKIIHSATRSPITWIIITYIIFHIRGLPYGAASSLKKSKNLTRGADESECFLRTRNVRGELAGTRSVRVKHCKHVGGKPAAAAAGIIAVRIGSAGRGPCDSGCFHCYFLKDLLRSSAMNRTSCPLKKYEKRLRASEKRFPAAVFETFIEQVLSIGFPLCRVPDFENVLNNWIIFSTRHMINDPFGIKNVLIGEIPKQTTE